MDIISLPIELIYLFFDLLDFKSLARICQTCSTFNNYIKNDFLKYKYKSDEQVNSITQTFDFVKKLKKMKIKYRVVNPSYDFPSHDFPFSSPLKFINGYIFSQWRVFNKNGNKEINVGLQSWTSHYTKSYHYYHYYDEANNGKLAIYKNNGKSKETIYLENAIRHIRHCYADDDNIILYNGEIMCLYDSEGKFIKKYNLKNIIGNTLYKSKNYCVIDVHYKSTLFLFDLINEKYMDWNYIFTHMYYLIEYFNYPYLIGCNYNTCYLDYEYTWILNVKTCILNKFYYRRFYVCDSTLIFVHAKKLLVYNLDTMELIETIQIDLDNIKYIGFSQDYFVATTKTLDMFCYELDS